MGVIRIGKKISKIDKEIGQISSSDIQKAIKQERGRQIIVIKTKVWTPINITESSQEDNKTS